MISPSSMFSLGIVLIAVFFTGGGNATIARGIIYDKGNILGLSPATFAATTFTVLTIGYGIVANSRFMNRIMPVIQPKDMTLYFYKRDISNNPDDFIDEDDIEAEAAIVADDGLSQPKRIYPVGSGLGEQNKQGMISVTQVGMFRPAENAPVQDQDRRAENQPRWLGNCQIL